MQKPPTKPPPLGRAVCEIVDGEGDIYIIEYDYLQEDLPGEVVNFNLQLWSKGKVKIQGSSLPHSELLPLDYHFTIEVQGEGQLQPTPGGPASEWTHITFLLPSLPEKTTILKIKILLDQEGKTKELPIPIHCIARTIDLKTKRIQTGTQKYDETRILFKTKEKKSLIKEDIMAFMKKRKGFFIALAVCLAFYVLAGTGIVYVAQGVFPSKPMIPKKVICEGVSVEKTPNGKYEFKDCELEF